MTPPGKMREVKQNIDAFGQHLFQVFGDAESDAFAYTVGNAEQGLPELLVIGNFPAHIIGLLLNDLGAKMREDGRPLPLGLVDIGWSVPVKIRMSGPAARDRVTIQASQYFGHDTYGVLQVMLCDPKNRYPGEDGCDPRYDVERP